MILSFEHIFILKCFYNSYFVRHICAYKWFSTYYFYYSYFESYADLLLSSGTVSFSAKHFGTMKGQIMSKTVYTETFQ